MFHDEAAYFPRWLLASLRAPALIVVGYVYAARRMPSALLNEECTTWTGYKFLATHNDDDGLLSVCSGELEADEQNQPRLDGASLNVLVRRLCCVQSVLWIWHILGLGNQDVGLSARVVGVAGAG